MSRSRAWLIILAALAVGAVGGNLLVRPAGPLLETGASCLWLAEAEKSGVLDGRKRADLVGRLAQSSKLDAKGKDIAARLATGCPKL